MQIQPDVNTKELESKAIALQKSLAFVNDGSGTDSSELFIIIHRPGWTTLRAVNEASDLLSAMEQRGVELQALKRRLQQHVEATVEKEDLACRAGSPRSPIGRSLRH
jgi:hypothetical protein